MNTNDFGMDFETDEEYERRAREAHPPSYAETIGEVRDENGELWNPTMHLMLHAVVLRQLDEWSKAEEVFDQLTEEYGMHEHAAIHALAAVTTDIMFGMMNEEPDNADPDEVSEKYNEKHARELENLVDPDSERHETWVTPFKQGDPPHHRSIQ